MEFQITVLPTGWSDISDNLLEQHQVTANRGSRFDTFATAYRIATTLLSTVLIREALHFHNNPTEIVLYPVGNIADWCVGKELVIGYYKPGNFSIKWFVYITAVE